MWEWILKNEKRLKGLCVAGCRGRTDLVDDIYSDVVLVRMPNIWKMHDPERGSVWTYASANLRRYIWKYMNKRCRLAVSDLDDAPEPGVHVDFDVKTRVSELMVCLSAEEQRVVVFRLVYEMSYKEIAVTIGVARPTASKIYKQALAKMRENNVDPS